MTKMNLSKKKKQKQIHRPTEQTCGCQRIGEGEGQTGEFGVSRCKLLHSEWINNRVLLYSTENYIQPNGIKNNGKKYFKKCIYEHN